MPSVHPPKHHKHHEETIIIKGTMKDSNTIMNTNWIMQVT